MEVDDHLAEVQSDTCAGGAGVLGVASLVEAVEDVFHGVAVDAFAVVDDFEASGVGGGAERHGDSTAVATVLERIAEQVGEHLVELVAVDPCLERMDVVVEEAEVDVSLLCVVVEHLAHALGECHEVGGLAVQVHLLLVDFPHVEDLVHEVQDAVGVVLDGVDVALCLGLTIAKPLLELRQRTHNECER